MPRSGQVLALTLALAAPAAAQTWTERGYVSINGAYQTATNDFSDRFEFEKDLETGSIEVDYAVKGDFLFDAGGGVRLWKGVGAGVAISYFTHDESAATRTQSPHPFFPNRFRAVSGDTTALARTETAVHVQAMYFLKPSGPLRIVFSGGPSFFNVEQEIVSAVVLTETYPYDTAEFGSAQTVKVKKTKTTFNVGADVMWMFTRSIGVGGLLHFSRASVDLDAPDDRTITVDAGGFSAGGGLRVVF